MARLKVDNIHMRIAMIGAKRMPSREGGVDVVVDKLSELLVKNGDEVTAFVRRKKGYKPEKIYNGVRIKKCFTVNKKSTDALIYSFFATLKGVFGKYDVLHFHAEGNTFFLWLTKLCKKKIVVTVHGIDWKREKFKGIGSRILLKSEKRIVKYADEIITLCESDRNYFLETYNKKTTLIPNGFEISTLAKPNLIKTQFGLNGNDYILYLARIVPEKGLHYLIDAYNSINIPQKLVIAGDNSHSLDYYREIKNKAKNNPNIIFTGFVQGLLLEELISNAYLYTLPSDIEGMPLSLLEALGHKRICLVSDIPENHIDQSNCYFFEKSNIKSLAEQLLILSSDKKKYTISTSLMGWEEVCSKTRQLYSE